MQTLPLQWLHLCTNTYQAYKLQASSQPPSPMHWCNLHTSVHARRADAHHTAQAAGLLKESMTGLTLQQSCDMSLLMSLLLLLLLLPLLLLLLLLPPGC